MIYPLLIVQTDLYGERYKKLADKVNELYQSEAYHNNIRELMRAFAYRDYIELCDKHILVATSLAHIIVNIDDWDDTIADNLDENDLEVIIKFCGITDFELK